LIERDVRDEVAKATIDDQSQIYSVAKKATTGPFFGLLGRFLVQFMLIYDADLVS